MPLVTNSRVFASLEWRLHSVADLAIAPIEMRVGPPLDRRRMPWIEHGWLVTDIHRNAMTYFGGPTVGDEVFMVGRFSGVHDDPQNNPVARFGYIASLPLELAHGPYYHQSYLVEMRSINQYSGSPVFSYVPKTEVLADLDREEALKNISFSSAVNALKGKPMVLGVDVGHLEERVRCDAEDTENFRTLKLSMLMNSVMSVVTPADYILEMLKMPDWEKHREQEESVAAKSIAESNVVEDFDVGSEDGPFLTREAFFDALRLASRPIDGNSEGPHTEGKSETSE
ncbi:MAG: hypothetical protein ACR2M4_11835 [Actinomycetota bacterium]